MYLECTVSFRCHIYWVYMSLFWWIWYTWSTLCEVFDVHDLLWNQCEISDIHDTLQVWNILYPTPHTPPHPTPHHRFCILSFACVRGYCKSVVLIAVDKLLKLTLSFYFICLLLFYLFIVIICGRHCYFICLLLLFVADIVSWGLVHSQWHSMSTTLWYSNKRWHCSILLKAIALRTDRPAADEATEMSDEYTCIEI